MYVQVKKCTKGLNWQEPHWGT